ncbi:CBS domain-containing protein [Altererythrobacter sp. CAU 1778]
MTIARIIAARESDAITSCSTGDTVAEAAALLSERRIGALPVFESGVIAGIFSERDLLYCIAREGAKVLDRQVGEVMTAPAITTTPQTSVIDALKLMTRRRIRHLPVVEGEQVRGFISIGDLVKYRMDKIEAERNQMREYIQTA